jgi:hypothetical protein
VKVTDTMPRTLLTNTQQRRVAALQVGAHLARGNVYRGLTPQEVQDALQLARFITQGE